MSQGLNQLSPEQQEEVHRVCDIIPNVEVKVRKHDAELWWPARGLFHDLVEAIQGV